jgi:hypothetical protein
MNRVLQEIRLALGALLLVQLINTLGTLAVLGRMSPMIEKILGENVSSLEASEGMLVELTHTSSTPAGRQRFESALDVAKNNVTMSEERPLLEMVDLMFVDALENPSSESRERTVAALGDLAALNRQAMHESNAQAKQLAASGAWASVLLGLVSLSISAVFVRRLTNQIAAPLSQLRNVVDAAVRGDTYRRFRGEGSPEVLEIGRGLNRLLDGRLEPIQRRSLSEVDRAAVLRLLDRAGTASVVIDHEGKVLVASQAALPMLEGDGGDETVRALAAYVREPKTGPLIIGADELIQGEAWLLDLQVPGPTATTAGVPTA